ncbi:MAG TPA: NFACT RNA binding domain-containing protein, partial [Gemmatimonadaceae bacterium]|nr:NFACT RNA binding domain-containing protein [Gemmatimonadaceae bacterium]
ARELDAAWRGRRVACFALDARPAAVLLGAAGAPTVRFDLSRPDVRVRHAPPTKDRGSLDGYEIVSVQAPTDERRIVVHLTKPGKFRGSAAREAELVVSVVPNARGAVLLSSDGHRFGAVGSRIPPVGAPRSVLAADDVRAAAARGDAPALLLGRWIGPQVAAWLIADPSTAGERYARIVTLPPVEPARCDGELLPFPLCDDPDPADSLIGPAGDAGGPGRPAREDPRTKAIERMRQQLELARAAPKLRAAADALMALAEGAAVPPSLTLPDGTPFALSSRPTDSAPAVAERLYARARAMVRARATLPERIARLEAALAAPVPDRPVREDASAQGEPRRSYKRFTSGGGLEIRVGRSAKDNDALTFHDSSPDDVWLHARGASGSHVVLRWTRAERPPAADLEEAALLAAWHSRARGSTVVPVDWTRRRYVRKPRGAAPGSVMVARAETVFVRPTAVAVRAIRDRS